MKERKKRKKERKKERKKNERKKQNTTTKKQAKKERNELHGMHRDIQIFDVSVRWFMHKVNDFRFTPPIARVIQVLYVNICIVLSWPASATCENVLITYTGLHEIGTWSILTTDWLKASQLSKMRFKSIYSRYVDIVNKY